MAKTNPIGVRFDEDLLKSLKEDNLADSPQKALNYLSEFYRLNREKIDFKKMFEESSLFKDKPSEPELKFQKPIKKKNAKLKIVDKIQYKAPDQSSYDSERISNLLLDEAGQMPKIPARPKNLPELKAMCPFPEGSDERRTWISIERQKYGI